MEFVGHDVCLNGNHPVMSKRALLEHWPAFMTARDTASFIGYLLFYSIYIPYFDQHVTPLQHVINKVEMDTVILDKLGSEAIHAHENMTTALCSDPCIARFDYSMRTYLFTEFSKIGFGYDICQPNRDDAPSMAAMRDKMADGECQFLLPKSKLRLRSTGFGSRTTSCRESCLTFRQGLYS